MSPTVKLYVEDKICALATPAGTGALSLIRVSGKNIEKIFQDIFHHSGSIKPRNAYFKKVFNSENQLLDEVVVTFFEENKSFTGESSFEITCHGSPLIVSSLISLLREKGVRLAEPGEFSYRAYLNGKIDLVKAEGIHHVIHAEHELSRDLSLNLLDDGLKNKILELKDAIVFAISRLEASIDFSDDDIDLEHDDEVFSKINFVKNELKKIILSYDIGSVQTKGVKVALFGPPNAGKSSLFNLLLNSERSIVSNELGTTRDYISDTVNLNGNSFKLIDTAGVRETENAIEKEGVKRSLEVINKSQLVLFVVSKDTIHDCLGYVELLEKISSEKIILIESKSDLADWTSDYTKFDKISFSIKNQDSFDVLKNIITEKLKIYFKSVNNLFVERHMELFSSSFKMIESIKSVEQISGFEDVLASQLYSSLSFLDQILFIDDPEAVRDKIFKDFCLGK